VEVCVSTILLLTFVIVQRALATLICSVMSDGRPVGGAEVLVAGRTVIADRNGIAQIEVDAGQIVVTVTKAGFVPVTMIVSARPEQRQNVAIELQPELRIEEQVTVAATRTDARLDDLPMRVEVLDREEIEEKQLMTPGDIVMMLNEMGGLRVQATSPSLGAASVRVQGMRGRYTRFLSDGLPLFGDGVGGLGLLQIPPTDLGQVEVIKGVASALYGAGALGGVVNLISRRPAAEPITEALVNRTTLGGTDAVFFMGRRLTEGWSATLLAGGHWQQKNDVDGDGWADLAGYSRAVVRPRIFWDNGAGRSMFGTAGVTWERRQGGTVDRGARPATGAPFVESLDTARVDGGVVAQTLVGGSTVVTARASVTTQGHDHLLGEIRERDRHDTIFAEIAMRGARGRHTWVAGAAFDRDSFDSQDLPRFSYAYAAPGLFAQDDVVVAPWMSVSASGRVDAHNAFATFFSPRVSTLVRHGAWNSRVSVGSGFFAPTPLTEETEAAGLSRLTIAAPLKVERGLSASWDVTRAIGPLAVTGTLFHYRVQDPSVVDRTTYTLATLPEPTVNTGAETVATWRAAPFTVTATYTYVRSLEGAGVERGDIPLTPRHSAGFIGMWERGDAGRIGVEAYLTGRQRLDDNPYRAQSAAYLLFGGLVERRVGRWRLFVNAENLANVRQTDRDPLLRPSRAADGRWTVDAWAPLDGRVINGGVRLGF
jgi:iron complex outermembrane receptor protein